MITFKKFLESYSVQFVRDKDVDVLKLKDSSKKGWVEVRGKKGYESGGYNKRDKLHSTIDKLGKAANISDLMNGDEVHINPKHPHAKKAIETIKKLMR